MLGIFSTPVEATQLPPLVSLDVSSISLALLVLGAYVCLVGQISYWLKEKLFISSALVSISIGIGPSSSTRSKFKSRCSLSVPAFGPIGANWISPWKWTNYDDNLRSAFIAWLSWAEGLAADILFPAQTRFASTEAGPWSARAHDVPPADNIPVLPTRYRSAGHVRRN